MSLQPDITIRDPLNPSNILGSFAYVQSAAGGNNIPVLHGQNSNLIRFRLYNNWARNSNIASALNVRVTVYDGSSLGSHTTTKSVVSQSWIRIFESGFGENSVTPGLYTTFSGFDTAIGKNNSYSVEYSSNGSAGSLLRAGSTGSGVGFIEFLTYAMVPDNALTVSWTFSLSFTYEWNP